MQSPLCVDFFWADFSEDGSLVLTNMKDALTSGILGQGWSGSACGAVLEVFGACGVDASALGC